MGDERQLELPGILMGTMNQFTVRGIYALEYHLWLKTKGIYE